MSGTEAILEMRHIGKYFGANVVLRDVNFSVREGEVTCIIGASGSGKSSIRCINLLRCRPPEKFFTAARISFKTGYGGGTLQSEGRHGVSELQPFSEYDGP